MSALERVARRIGLRPHPDGGDGGPCWVDDVGDYACEAGQFFLRTYLLTGDRPLRVQVEYEMDTAVNDDGWIASAYTTKNGWRTVSVTREELRAAIIALAERIEGEERE